MVMVGGSRKAMFQAIFVAPLMRIAGNRWMGINPWEMNKEEDLSLLIDLHRRGKVMPVIDKRIPLEGVPRALRYLLDGKARGKVVVTM